MAAAYRAPLAGSLFIAEVLFGTMMLASLGPVIISAVVALLVSNLINHSDALLYNVQLSVTVQARDYALIISTGVLAGLCGPLLLTLMNACHRGFVSLKLAPPWQLALGGLIVGLLSLFTPAVWGNGYSTVQSFLTAPPLLMIIAGIFLCNCVPCWRVVVLARPVVSLHRRYLSVLPLACCMVVAWDYGYLMAKKLRFYSD